MLRRDSMFDRSGRVGLVLAFLACAVIAADGEEAGVRSGVIGRFVPSSEGVAVWRIDPDVLFDWHAGSPDLRVSGETFSAAWKGLLFVRTEGVHRLHLYLTGRATVTCRATHTTPPAGSESSKALTAPST